MSTLQCAEPQTSLCVIELLSLPSEEIDAQFRQMEKVEIIDFGHVESVTSWFIASLAKSLLERTSSSPELQIVSTTDQVQRTLTACGLSEFIN
ncbi:MAG TPA: hypothetical protein DD473_24200 [Planctomycetaceae bacterium]|nr:hypothetical protein [Planctomycetaceae bacterium]|tara:strand:+ start:133 stop:411 length:279 start_codon:yes stop_codon:yes gene_type:complete